MNLRTCGIVAGFLWLGSVALCPAALAETIKLKAELSGASEVPPNNSPATGHADITLDTATKMLTWTVTYSGLTGPAIGAHFHGPSQAGGNAGIVVPFYFVATPIKGNVTLTEAQIGDVEAGRWYVNIHTAAHPGGEIRGQVVR